MSVPAEFGSGRFGVPFILSKRSLSHRWLSISLRTAHAPTTPSSAFPLGSKGKQDPVEMYMNDIFTVPANLAGLPALSLPVGLDELGLPLGIQLIGDNWQEQLLLNTAFNLENALAFESNPKIWWA